MPVAPSITSYSATVSLQLQCPAGLLELDQVGSEWFIAAAPVELPPCEAELIVIIDDNERRSKVRLPQGMSSSGGHIPYERIES